MLSGFAAAKARELGLRVDITLGSGWPYGGPHVPITEAAGKLRVDRVPIPAGAGSIPLPSLENGEKPIAAFLDGGTQRLAINSDRLQLPSDLAGPHTWSSSYPATRASR